MFQKKNTFETIVRKGESAVTSTFSFFHNVFLPFLEQISIFRLHLFCCLQMLQFGLVYDSVV